MKTISQFFEEKKSVRLKDNGDTLPYISGKDLKEYLAVVKPFGFTSEGISIINWLITNENTYYNDLSSDTDGNPLIAFFNNGRPKKENMAALWDNIEKLVKIGREKEIPLLLTNKQFKDIVSGKVKPDVYVYGLDTEAGRNKAAIMFKPLIIKICNQWHGKSNMNFEDLQSAAYEGFTKAMNNYGKTGKKKEEGGEDTSKMSFMQYAAYIIRWQILDDVKNVSQTVRVAISQQNKERKEKGANTKNNTISGNKTVGHDSEGEGKTLFDYMGVSDDVEMSMNQKDLDRLWKQVYKMLEDEFDKKIIDIFCSFYGINGFEKIKNLEIAKKYNVVPSNITYYVSKVKQFILKDKKARAAFQELYELMHECKAQEDANGYDFEPIYVK